MKHKHICPWCNRPFFPNPRLGKRQKSCGSSACKEKQKTLSQSNWIAKNKKVYQDGQRDWRENHPDYWKNYRALHPDYVVKNRAQTRIRKTFTLSNIGLQKRIDILQLHDNQHELWNIDRFAKQSRSLFFIFLAKPRICTIQT